MLVPFLMLLAGGVKLYLTPNKYRSTTLFSLENGPPPEEIIVLVKSRSVLDRMVDRLQLAHRFSVDKETAVGIIRGITDARIVADTQLIEINVTLTNKVDARDVAEQIPNCLRDYLVEISRKKNKDKAGEIDQLIGEATDMAGDKSSMVVNMEKFHGANPADSAVVTKLERARRASMLADAEVERLKNLRSACLTENLETLPRLNIHTAPVISAKAHSPDVGKKLETLVLKSLIYGLLAALLLPYLMELVFAPRQDDIIVPDGSGLKFDEHGF
jgi:hypothetical protein